MVGSGIRSLNIQYKRNSTIVCPIKMEYGSEINIFALKMLMKSGLEKTFLKLGSFHKLRLHLGVGRWSEKHVVYYIKSAN